MNTWTDLGPHALGINLIHTSSSLTPTIWATADEALEHAEADGDHAFIGTPASFTLQTLSGYAAPVFSYAWVGIDAGVSTFLDLTDTPSGFGTVGQVAAVNAARTALEFVDQMGGGVSSVITRPEPGTAADASFDAIYGGGAGAVGQDYLSYKRLVADHTVRLTVHNLNEINFTTEKRGWASQANLIQGNIAGGAARPSPDGVEGIIEYKDATDMWRIWLFTVESGEWADPTRSYEFKYVEVGLGGAVTTITLDRDAVTGVGEWRAVDAGRPPARASRTASSTTFRSGGSAPPPMSPCTPVTR